MDKNGGFTFIELMFVIVIIGVLAAIATPKLSTSVVKAHHSQGYALFGHLKNDIAEHYGHTGTFPTMGDFPFKTPGKQGSSIDKVTIDKGVVTITFSKEIEMVANDTLRFTPREIKVGTLSFLEWDSQLISDSLGRK